MYAEPGSQPVSQIVEVKCNKCGVRKELVFEGRLCGNCSTAVDERWATSTSTDWVLVEHLAEGAAPSYGPDVGVRNDRGEVVHTFQKVSYRYMKSTWAEIVGNSWSIRPASPEEIANRSRTFQIWCTIYEIIDKLGFDSNGQPPGGIWHEVALLCGRRALKEVKKKLGELGFLANLDDWQVPQRSLSPYEIAERINKAESAEAGRLTDARSGPLQNPGIKTAKVAVGTCNKCGALKELAFENRVCESCSRAQDERWAANPSTDWVLVQHAIEGAEPTVRYGGRRNDRGEIVHTFLKVPYTYMKALWGRGSDPTWSIKPATPKDIATRERSFQAFCEACDIVEKWGFDSEGQPPVGIWDSVALERGKRALEELNTRLKDIGFVPHLEDWELPCPWGLSPFEISEGIEEGEINRAGTGPPTTRQGLSQVVGMSELK
jgi:hypothetical protein